MARTFTRDDVLRLAPDAGSAKSGQDLAQVRKWGLLEHDDIALWGECQGSGAKPYRVQIDLAEPAFKCSCPSRKFPCKHGLALLLIYATTPDAPTAAAQPDWVQEWLASRQARASKAAEKQSREPAPRDPAAQAKRREKRIERARAGLADLSAWMRDLVRTGIGTAPGRGFEYFDSQARRMVDAQAPGVARLVRQLGSLASAGAGWQRPFLEQLSLVHLLTAAVERFAILPEAIRADVEGVLGITTAADELSELAGVADLWQVVAQEVELEDRLRVQRTWLYGAKTERVAQVLQFAHGAAAFDNTLSPGTEFEGELVFFPGSGLRAVVRTQQPNFAPLAALAGLDRFDQLLDRYSAALAEFPWLERLCLPLRQVTPARVDERWWIVDATGAALATALGDDAGYLLLAVSGGRPVDLAAEYDGQRLRPLTVIVDGKVFSLATNLADAA
ncbi:MAG: SWIM zinc finger domain-containing protein [Pirellulales bacterium]